MLTYDFDPFELPGSSMSKDRAEQLWKGKLISGQWWRWFSTYPDDLQKKPELDKHRALPDHDVLAVDGPVCTRSPHIYEGDEAKFTEQFKLRRHAAFEHVRQTYLQWRQDHGK